MVAFARGATAFEGSKTVTADLAAAEIQLSTDDAAAMEDPNQFERLSNKELLLQNIDYALDIFLIYVLTLSIFPGFIAEDTRSHSLGSWYTLVLITMYHVWDLVGGILFHSEAWRSRVDDNVDVLLGTQPWLPQCLYFFRSTKRIQGSETKCIGELVVCSSDYRYFLRCWTQLVMANWQRFVINSIVKYQYYPT
ncbi:equilibrative nucleotide transporter 3-like [Zingiber officinale]|uniref:equilibrative nucleotide transporter 3-like n=1 Tax=Zingiber officinale TaxID=94328 RepID=UPI001C4C25AC|nr:equilibrative nucleotide transporter 3-like [Zingiber officinale]